MNIRVKHKRGIRIQTRYIVSALLLLLQLFVLFAAVYNLSAHSKAIYSAAEACGVITVIYIVNRRGNPSYKIAWIIFILLFPIFGVSLFLLWGGGRVVPRFKKKMRECESHYLPLLREREGIHSQLRRDMFFIPVRRII